METEQEISKSRLIKGLIIFALIFLLGFVFGSEITKKEYTKTDDEIFNAIDEKINGDFFENHAVKQALGEDTIIKIRTSWNHYKGYPYAKSLMKEVIDSFCRAS